MVYHLEIADKQMKEMEDLLSKDDELTYEDDERLQELYYEVKENLEMGRSMILEYGRQNKIEIKELEKFEMRFKNVCTQFDTPDDINDATMNDMFPDDDSMEGFDWTLE